jgi:murein DD-endopeptidase MepM/ murein hydrolase activator NlpD
MYFIWPIGSSIEERGRCDKLPGFWQDATPYGTRYLNGAKWAIHTGCDLNLNFDLTGKFHFDLDAHSPVYAAAPGVVTFCAKLPVWGMVVVVEHAAEAGNEGKLWTRYAHVEALLVKQGDRVSQNTQLAQVGNADNRYPYHLHYDIARIDLTQRPGDWPGDDRNRVLLNYLNPYEVMRAQLMNGEGGKLTRWRVIAQPLLNVRSAPDANSSKLATLPYGAIVTVIEEQGDWGKITLPGSGKITGWIMQRWTIPAV